MYETKIAKGNRDPWEVLFDLVKNHSDLIRFHVGKMVMTENSLQNYFRNIYKGFMGKEDMMISYIFSGGELLTRCKDQKILHDVDIGKAFGLMPPDKMAEIFPALLELQLIDVSRKEFKPNVYYSINLECLDYHSAEWKKVCKILVQYGHLPVNIEIKENAEYTEQALYDLARVCEQTGMRIYIDDLGSNCHQLPKYNGYMKRIIRILHKHIKVVKVDFQLMDNLREREKDFLKIQLNMKYFTILWMNTVYPLVPLPWVIFESAPSEDKMWLNWFESEMALHYAVRGYQKG